jgi:transposase
MPPSPIYTSLEERSTRVALGEAGIAASRVKNTYLAARYKRIAARRGVKRALVAIEHSVLIAVWHILSDDVDYHDLGADYYLVRLDAAHRTRQARRRITELEQLGYRVILEPRAA